MSTKTTPELDEIIDDLVYWTEQDTKGTNFMRSGENHKAKAKAALSKHVEQERVKARDYILEELAEQAIEYDAVTAETWDWQHKDEAPRMMIPLNAITKLKSQLKESEKA